MVAAPKIFVLLPAFNEVDAVPRLIPALHEELSRLGSPFEIVVCNDGSTDATGKALSELRSEVPVTVLSHSRNRGLGETERDLFEYAADHGVEGDVAVRLDCDDTHEARSVIQLARPILEQRADIVIGSRFQPGGGSSGADGIRRFLSFGASFVMRALFPIKGVRDYSCGFRAYQVGILKRALDFYGNNFLQLRSLGFASTVEALVKLAHLGARCTEVPLWVFYERKQSESRMVASVTVFGYLVLMVLCYWPRGGWYWRQPPR